MVLDHFDVRSDLETLCLEKHVTKNFGAAKETQEFMIRVQAETFRN